MNSKLTLNHNNFLPIFLFFICTSLIFSLSLEEIDTKISNLSTLKSTKSAFELEYWQLLKKESLNKKEHEEKKASLLGFNKNFALRKKEFKENSKKIPWKKEISLETTSLDALQSLVLDTENQIQTIRSQITKITEKTRVIHEKKISLPEKISSLKKSENEKLELASELSKNAGIPDSMLGTLIRENLEIEQENLTLELSQLDQNEELMGLELLNLEATRNKLESFLDSYRKKLESLNKKESEQLRQTIWDLPSEDLGHPYLVKFWQENKTLLENFELSSARLDVSFLRKKTAKLEKQVEKILSHHNLLKTKLQTIGLSGVMGKILLEELNSLPQTKIEARSLKQNEEIHSELQLEMIDLREKSEFLRPDLLDLPADFNLSQQKNQKNLFLLIEQRQQILKKKTKLLEEELLEILNLITAQQKFIKTGNLFHSWLLEHTLWTRSHPVFSPFSWFLQAKDSFTSIVETIKKEKAARVNIPHFPFLLVFCLFFAFYLQKRKPYLVQILEKTGAEIQKVTHLSTFSTFKALSFTILLSLSHPLFLLSFFIFLFLLFPELYLILNSPVQNLLIFYCFYRFFRALCRPGGVGEKHFSWNLTALIWLREKTPTLILGMLSLDFILAVSLELQNPARDFLQRLILPIFLLLFSAGIYRFFSKEMPWIPEILKKSPTKSFRLLLFLQPLAVFIPFFAMLLSVSGYHYSALKIDDALKNLILFLAILKIGKALLLRWFFNLRRAFFRSKYKQKLEIGESSKNQEEFLSIQSRIVNLVDNLSLIAMIFGFIWILRPVFPGIDYLQSIEIYQIADPVISANGDVLQKAASITIADLLFSIISLILTWVFSKNLPDLLELSLLKKIKISTGELYAIHTLITYLILMIGAAFSLHLLGIRWSQVQWLVAAMSVGLGFGLQEIFANMISGIILLFEQPIRKNDLVTVGDISGKVSKINIRATTIVDFNNKELVVPNKEFITSQLINWSLSSPVLRLVLPIGVSYKSDVKRVKAVLFSIAQSHNKVLEDPKPQVILNEFADSSINFELRIFISDTDSMSTIRDEIHTNIFYRFAQEGIEMPFPQRDLHIKELPFCILPQKDSQTESKLMQKKEEILND